MVRLLICTLTLGLTVAFLSCKSDGLNDDGSKKDAGPTATGGGSNLTSNTIHGDGIYYASSSGGDTRASSPIHGDGASAPVGGVTRATSTTYISMDGKPATSGGRTGTSSSRTMQGDGILPTGGTAGYLLTTYSIGTGGHIDGHMPVGGTGGTGTGDDTGGGMPVGGSGGKSSRQTIQGDGIYPPVGGHAGAVGGGGYSGPRT
jgi:hypothetical protein